MDGRMCIGRADDKREEREGGYYSAGRETNKTEPA